MLASRWLPHPLMSLSLLVIWLLLQNDVSAGLIVLGAVFAILIPLFTAQFWTEPVTIGAWLAGIRFGSIVLWDIIVANVQVAGLILFRRPQSLTPAFLVIPLDIQSPYAIAILAGTITMTPGTVSADLDPERHHLLVHGLSVDDPDAMIANIKRRYEAPLKQIFG